MQREIILDNKKISYQLRKSQHAKHIYLKVKNNAEVIVTIPQRANEKIAEEFIFKKARWLLSKVDYFKNNPSVIPSPNRKDYLKYKELARQIVERKLVYLNEPYNFSYEKIFIRNPKTRWGSCSEKGNLNFSYRIIFLSERLCDYIIVHELCHLKEFNHSQRFWNLVAKTVPNYKEIKKKIKTI